jgi:hypothetical protein
MLSLHEDVLDFYLNERTARPFEGPDGRLRLVKPFVEFNGTITEAAPTERNRVLVARWSVDLMGRITVQPIK